MKLGIGLDVGQRREASGLCVVVVDDRHGEGEREVHFTVRYLSRLPVGSSHGELAKTLHQVATAASDRAGASPSIFVDVTGLGHPIIESLSAPEPPGTIIPVYFNHGDQRSIEGTERAEKVILGKAYLVSRLQLLLQSNRLHLPKTQEAETLAGELTDYEIRIGPKANDTYGAFRVGAHDELVTALGLAVQVDEPGPASVWDLADAWGDDEDLLS